MNAPGRSASRKGAFRNDARLARRVAVKRSFARLVLFTERLLPLILLPAGLAAVFVSLAWFGVFRMLPDVFRFALLFLLVFGFIASLLPFARLRWPDAEDADRLLEERNLLPHQPVAVQEDEPAFETPFARALWEEHQRRMAERIAALDAGLPQPDIARFDRFALRTIPALLIVTAFAYSGSNGAGSVRDAFRLDGTVSEVPATRIDAWITPPSYTNRAPVFLTGQNSAEAALGSVPQFSQVTVRISGGNGEEQVRFLGDGAEPIDISAEGADAAQEAGSAPVPPTPAPAATTQAARTFNYKIETGGVLQAADREWQIGVVPDKAPEIAFDGMPRRAVNGALEIAFIARDDYGLQQAHAIIEPAGDVDAEATPLYPPPEYKLDLPRHNARESKGVSSRNLTEHPMAGKRVRITLVARDGAGQEGRSQPYEMVLPSRNFSQLLAAAVAEQRQVFALDTRKMPEAVALNEALTIRADETIPNLSHYLLIESARFRMKQAQSPEAMKETADYLWEIALGIEDGNLSLAERRLRDAQQALADALDRNAPDEEIKRLMDELRAAMQEFMQALAQQQQGNMADNQQQPQNMLRAQDLNNMLDQIENLARSGNRDAAQQMLSELQRMMNNLQAGRPQQGNQQENSQMRQQIDKLGELMQQQQRLMDQTFQLDQALRDRMQRGDPEMGENGQSPDQQQSTDQMTAEQLREALKNLQQQQQALGEQLQELQEGLKGMGIQPGNNFAEAESQMRGAGDALGRSQGERAVEGQGKALEALRQGARDMMNQMMQAMRGQQGQGQGQQQGMTGQGNQNGRDPLGRPRATSGPDFGENVRVPDEIDVQRAREILEAIRRKLEENSGRVEERRYLERLLDIQQ
ncbi:TIGR02302 family protein [Ciceribacter sp. L1K23]|uniref:TIGR02302 family protein n=1 Tax=Ciceribacter sp. L1K23 TaxID=2820276 RepID=UPI001B81074B|nr:TIGR02302 family protein [Ciceribacter sp. L1K23]MBR0554251.1 TIGR02302 family protein [Ciceribacter sp. L1K23]